MITPNEFWLALHNLAEAYDAEGFTAQERSRNVMDQLRRMPPSARRQVLSDMQQLAVHIDDLFAEATHVVRDEEGHEQPQHSKAR